MTIQDFARRYGFVLNANEEFFVSTREAAQGYVAEGNRSGLRLQEGFRDGLWVIWEEKPLNPWAAGGRTFSATPAGLTPTAPRPTEVAGRFGVDGRVWRQTSIERLPEGYRDIVGKTVRVQTSCTGGHAEFRVMAVISDNGKYRLFDDSSKEKSFLYSSTVFELLDESRPSGYAPAPAVLDPFSSFTTAQLAQEIERRLTSGR